MELNKLKMLMRKSEVHRVNYALGLTATHEPVLLLHEHKRGKALANDLRNECPDGIRYVYGDVEVDSPEGHYLAKFTVNKESSWVEKALIRALKGTKYKTVEVSLQQGDSEERDK
jgi:hypothetical protein